MVKSVSQETGQVKMQRGGWDGKLGSSWWPSFGWAILVEHGGGSHILVSWEVNEKGGSRGNENRLLFLKTPWWRRGRSARCQGRGLVFCFVVQTVTQGLFPTQGSTPCLLHWQANSLPPSHLGSLLPQIKNRVKIVYWHHLSAISLF